MIISQIIEIGKKALSDNDAMVILFDESATEELRTVSLIQRFDKTDVDSFALKEGDSVEINSQKYTINYIGSLVNENLSKIGHTSLIFKDVPDSPLQSAIYLSPKNLPEFKVGTTIKYQF